MIWRQGVDLVEGAEYKFKGFLSAASALNPTQLDVRFSFDGRQMEFLSRFSPPPVVGDWLGIEAGFLATGRRVTISIFDTTTGADGNDFGLDDLRLVRPAVAPPPPPSAVPELATSMTMILGFGLAGTVMRQRVVTTG